MLVLFLLQGIAIKIAGRFSVNVTSLTVEESTLFVYLCVGESVILLSPLSATHSCYYAFVYIGNTAMLLLLLMSLL